MHDLFAPPAWKLISVWGTEDDGTCRCVSGAECKSAGKHPVHRGWQVPDRPEWRPRAGENVGVVTGPESGIWVLDIDNPLGWSTLQHWTEAGLHLPETLMQHTPSGGLHYFYRWPAGGGITNTQSALGPGIDTRGGKLEGDTWVSAGFVVIAPSTVGAATYDWAGPPEDFPVVEAPEWLLALLRFPGLQHACAAPRRRIGRPSTLPESRHAGLLRMTYAMACAGEHATDTFDRAVQYAQDHSLDQDRPHTWMAEVERAVKGAYAKTTVTPSPVRGWENGKRLPLERRLERLHAWKLEHDGTYRAQYDGGTEPVRKYMRKHAEFPDWAKPRRPRVVRS